jgi:uncharacterized lipoprotein YmbA
VNLKPKPDTVRLFVLGSINVEADVEPGAQSTAVYIARPDLPNYLDSTQLQFRHTDGEVQALRGARWAESLQDGVARALSEFIGSARGSSTNGYYPWPQLSAATPQVRVRLFQYGATVDGRIQLTANWRIEGPDGVLRQGTYSADGVSWHTGDAPSLVAGLNAALKALAAEIASAL